jgi:hypothetical protein
MPCRVSLQIASRRTGKILSQEKAGAPFLRGVVPVGGKNGAGARLARLWLGFDFYLNSSIILPALERIIGCDGHCLSKPYGCDP